MAFNSHSYYRNKYRREAIAELAKARRIKAGKAEPIYSDDYWLGSAVRMARVTWRLYLIKCRICELSGGSAPYQPEPWTTRELANG